MKLTPEQRGRWILNWIKKKNEYGVDVLYKKFVEDYVDATEAQHKIQFFGAPKCPQLGKDLAALYYLGYLSRYATGLSPGDSAMGFPKWVYVYKITEKGIAEIVR